MLVQSLASGITNTTKMQPNHALAVAQGVVTSMWVTGVALLGGMLVQSYADGAHSPSAFIGWLKDGHAYGYIIGQIIAPALRGTIAYRNSTTALIRK